MRYAPAWLLAVVAGCGGEEAPFFSDPDIADVYDHCEMADDCGYGSVCVAIALDYGSSLAEASMCTRSCEDDDDCDYGGRCVHPKDRPAFCHQRCMSTHDCWVGDACVDLYGDHDPVCAPQ